MGTEEGNEATSARDLKGHLRVVLGAVRTFVEATADYDQLAYVITRAQPELVQGRALLQASSDRRVSGHRTMSHVLWGDIQRGSDATQPEKADDPASSPRAEMCLWSA